MPKSKLTKLSLKEYCKLAGYATVRWVSQCCKEGNIKALKGVAKIRLKTPLAGSPYYELTMKSDYETILNIKKP